MSQTMIEKLERAIFACSFHPDEDPALIIRKWDEFTESHAKVRRQAVAALNALREPSGDMCHAAMLTMVHENKGIEYSPALGWKAMIDQALKEIEG